MPQSPLQHAPRQRATPLQVADYALYSRASTGTSAPKRITALPNGPGFPSVNAMAGDAAWVFLDFASLHVVALPQGAIAPPLPFVAAPRIIGFPRFVPA